MKNVLIVDGERAIRNTLKERLEYESYRVEVAANGDEAMYKIGRIPFNVVLCAMNLPDMKGVDLINNFKTTRFIIVSSQNDVNEAVESIRCGAYDYISKPIDLNKLLFSMRTLLEEQSQNHATNAQAAQEQSKEFGSDCLSVASSVTSSAALSGASLAASHLPHSDWSSATSVTSRTSGDTCPPNAPCTLTDSNSVERATNATSSAASTSTSTSPAASIATASPASTLASATSATSATASTPASPSAPDFDVSSPSADDPTSNADHKMRSTPGMRRRSCMVDKIIGESLAITHVKRLIDKVGPSEARVLITGASGTGKELVARWLHEKSHRSGGPFIEVNCAAIPSELIESELFGHEKGAFTSAIKQRKGKFEQADGGTLFLDEIGDMSLSAQAKVLRALQEHKVCRVGSDKDIEVNVRVLAATNKNLQREIASAAFREDLYHRLSVIIIRLPALRERKEDISLLVGHFIGRVCKEYNIERKKIDPDALDVLISMDWTGNIRELSNVIERLIVLSGKVITLEDVNMYAVEASEV